MHSVGPRQLVKWLHKNRNEVLNVKKGETFIAEHISLQTYNGFNLLYFKRGIVENTTYIVV